MLKGTVVKMSSCLAIVLEEEQRGAYCSPPSPLPCTHREMHWTTAGRRVPNVCKKTSRLLWLCNPLALWAELYKSCSFNMWLQTSAISQFLGDLCNFFSTCHKLSFQSLPGCSYYAMHFSCPYNRPICRNILKFFFMLKIYIYICYI